MTEQSTSMETSDFIGRPSISSRLAILSFASGLILCCPGTGALAVITGCAALLLGIREPGASWRKFALGGVALGAVGLIALSFLYLGIHGWWEREGRLLYSGPNNALVALDSGSIEGFRAEFIGKGAEAPDADIEAFAGQLEEHFGQFRVCRSTRQDEPPIDGAGPWELGEFEAVFDRGEPPTEARRVPAVIGIERQPSGTLRLTWVLIDPEGARIRYPPLPAEEESDG